MSNIEKKRGTLSTEERQTIERMAAEGSTVDEISRAINRNNEPVLNYISKHNVVLKTNDEKTNERIVLRDKLMSKHYWADITEQLNEPKGEIKLFVEHWIDFVIQFGDDITKTEESQIKDMIIVDILISRQMKDTNKNLNFIDTLQDEYNAEAKKEAGIRDDVRMTELEGLISMVRGTLGEFNRQYKDLLERKSKLLNDLKATRDQRVKKIEDSLTTFTNYIKLLQDEEAKLRVGEQIELMRVAGDRSKVHLSQLHIYGDGKGDLPLLTADTYAEYLKNQTKLEKEEQEQINEDSTNNGN